MCRKAEPSTATNKPEQTRDRHGFRGVPPPPTFSLAALADDCLLTEFEVAAVLRVSTNSLGGWRRQPDHPLRWIALPNGFVRYIASAIRTYLASGRSRKRKPQPEPSAQAAKPRAAPPKRRVHADVKPSRPRATADESLAPESSS